MSKLAKKPIEIPPGVAASLKDCVLEVKGKNASISVVIPPGIEAAINDDKIALSAKGNGKQTLSNWGTTAAHIKNAIAGSMADFTKELSAIGIGFKMALEGKTLVLNIGFSHPVRFPIPEGVKITLDKNNIAVSGPSRWLVGETAARIRDLRRPEPYQGKGIRYKDEVVRRKAGKKAAATSGTAAK